MDGGASPTTPSDVLLWWERTWHGLAADQRATFLRRAEIDELCSLPAWAVQSAMLQRSRLVDVLTLAMTLIERDAIQMPAVVPAAAEEGQEADAEAEPGGGAARPWGQRGVPPVLGGGGARPPSGGGGAWMSRPMSAMEPAIGERCSLCKAWVPSGVAHDCA